MYTDFWGLRKPPFDNVPDPTMYVDSHVSVENTIAETLFAIEEGNECLTVIVGDVGLGKTMSLRMILDSLDHEKYKIAFVTNPDMSFVQLLKEIIGQLMGKECEIRGKIELLEVFNKLLFETADEGKKILIFIDEANAISPTNLESLRLLTNMQDDDRNLFTIVLAGQLEFAKRLEHRSRANLYQRIGTYNKIEKMESEEVVRKYVETRMKLAGSTRKIFTDDAIHWLWEYSEHGVPRLLNKIAKLCLKAGETNNFHEIGGDVVQQIGERFEKMTGPAVQKRKVASAPRVSPPIEKSEAEPAYVPEKPARAARVRREESPAPEVWSAAPPPPPLPVFESPSEPETVKAPVYNEPVAMPVPEPEKEPVTPPTLQGMTPEEEPLRDEDVQEEEIEELSIETNAPPPLSFDRIIGREIEGIPGAFESTPVLPDLKTKGQAISEEEPGLDGFSEEPAETVPIVSEEPFVADVPRIIKTSEPTQSTHEEFIPTAQERTSIPDAHITLPTPPPPNRVPPVPPVSRMQREETISEVRTSAAAPQEAPQRKEDLSNTIVIAGCKIDIELPPHIVDQNRSSSMDQKRKIAGVLAAQTLEKNPQLTASPTVDPVAVWSDILNAIVERLN